MIKKRPRLFIISLIVLLIVCVFIAINVGSIKVSAYQLFEGLFIKYNEDVASIYQIRFPRIIVAIIVGASLALSGLLFQVVLKNPLADPGIIGISNGALLFTTLITLFVPGLYYYLPIFAFIGAMLTFILIYRLSWKMGLQTTKVLLIGVAINYGINALINLMNTSNIITNQMTYLTFKDVKVLIILLPILVLSLLLAKACDLLGLEERTLISMGINVDLYRLVISLVAVLLCSISVAVVGVIGFIGLLVPHFARILIGNRHKYLIVVTMLLGSITLLIGDTVGRVILAPYEVSPATIMALIGSPLFIVLVKRGFDNDKS